MGSFQSYNLGVDGVDGVIDVELSELPIYNPDNSASITPSTPDNPDNLLVLADPADILEVEIYFKFLRELVPEGRQIGLPNGWKETFKDHWS